MPILRPCGAALATALQGGIPITKADLFTVTLQNGTVYRWTSWPLDVTVGGNLFTSALRQDGSGAWLQRGQWNIVNTMQVPTLEVTMLMNAVNFSTGSAGSLRTQVHNGLFDGATWFLQYLFMWPTNNSDTIDIFIGDSGAVSLQGAQATFKVRGKVSRLDRPTPRNVYQPGCIHSFCDPGCTLSAASFTFPATILSATRTVLNFPTGLYTTSLQEKSGTVTITSGAATSNPPRSIIDFTFQTVGLINFLTSITLAYPLTVAPVVGDTCTIFRGCDKTQATCGNVYSNTVNFRGFPFIPPPSTTAPSQ